MTRGLRKKIKVVFGVLLVLIASYVVFRTLESHKINQCLNNAMVWDYDENRCRNDCLKWGENFGCIQLTTKEIEQIDNCRYKTDCITDEMVRTICLRNDKAYDEGSRNCKYDFKLELCGKLTGIWTYPSVCEK